MGEVSGRVALVFRGDRRDRSLATAEKGRLAPVATALNEVGLAAETAVFDEDAAEEVRDQLLHVQGALVWVDPVTGAADREILDGILREVAAAGVWVSAHPDVILKMGTKEVLHRTRDLGWGSDIRRYRTPAEFADQFPACLAEGTPRVLKQYRGNGGIGVWKVEMIGRGGGPDPRIRVQGARARDETTEDVLLSEFMNRCLKYFAFSGGQGRLIDQPFQPRITEGLIRAYLVKERVVGFARQYPAAEQGSQKVFGLPAAKTMYGPEEPAFASLRQSLELDWVPAMQSIVEVDTAALPALWDADFLFGPRTGSGTDTYVLSEINVSAVAPFPDQALAPLARAVRAAIDSVGRTLADPR